MNARASRQNHAPVRAIPHIQKLDDAFGQFLVRLICDCDIVSGYETMADIN